MNIGLFNHNKFENSRDYDRFRKKFTFKYLRPTYKKIVLTDL